jgi:hypothetical protein
VDERADVVWLDAGALENRQHALLGARRRRVGLREGKRARPGVDSPAIGG